MSDQRSVDRADRRSGRWGRRVASIIVWIAMIYAAVAGMVSVVPQVFWPQPPAWAVKAAPASCAEGLRELEGELMSRAAERVATGSPSGARPLRLWLSGWDDRFLALKPHCTTEAETHAYQDLNRLRHHMETSLLRFDREEGHLIRSLDDQLRGLGERSTGETP